MGRKDREIAINKITVLSSKSYEGNKTGSYFKGTRWSEGHIREVSRE